jgi:hypothetical protein
MTQNSIPSSTSFSIGTLEASSVSYAAATRFPHSLGRPFPASPPRFRERPPGPKPCPVGGGGRIINTKSQLCYCPSF